MSCHSVSFVRGSLPSADQVESEDVRLQRLAQGEVIEYRKGECKTSALMGVDKTQLLGSGKEGMVFVANLASFPRLYAVKKGRDLSYEHRIGRCLSEDPACPPHFLRVYGLVKKVYSDRRQPKCRLLMERIDGVTCQMFRLTSKQKIGKEAFCQLLEQIRASCLYLHHKEICWHDVDGRNVMIDQIDSSPRLRFIDYGLWRFRSDCTEDENYWTDYFPKFIRNAEKAVSDLCDCMRVPDVKIDFCELREKAHVQTSNRRDERRYLEAYFDALLESASSQPT